MGGATRVLQACSGSGASGGGGGSANGSVCTGTSEESSFFLFSLAIRQSASATPTAEQAAATTP